MPTHQPFASEERLLQQILVVADQKPTADPARRGPQLAGPSEHQLEQFCVGRAVRVEVEADDLPALRDPELVDAFEQLERRASFDRLCIRALELAVLDSMLRKKLLRLFTTLSARAVIPPLECVGHVRALPGPPPGYLSHPVGWIPDGWMGFALDFGHAPSVSLDPRLAIKTPHEFAKRLRSAYLIGRHATVSTPTGATHGS